MRQVWPDTAVEEGNLSQNIYTLRRVLSDADGKCPFIETVPRRGYRFVGSVRLVQDAERPSRRRRGAGPRRAWLLPAWSDAERPPMAGRSALRLAGRGRGRPLGWGRFSQRGHGGRCLMADVGPFDRGRDGGRADLSADPG